MKKVKEIYDKIFSNPLVKRIALITLIFIFIVIMLIIFVSCSNNKKVYSYTELEAKMIDLTKKRYSLSKYKDKLPKNDGDVVEVSLQSFVDDGTFKNIQSLTKNKSVCSGNVKIINNNNHYLFVPYLDCGKDYKTNTIYDVLTSEDNIASSGNGLYKVGEGYIFKGDSVNNYLKIDDHLYRIININSDGFIKILDTKAVGNTLWDDRYNIDTKRFDGINDYMINNINSRIKDKIENFYNETIPDYYKVYFTTFTLCTGKRGEFDDIFTYVECNNQSLSYQVSTLLVPDFYNASLDKNCKAINDSSCFNYNFMTSIGSTWTITGSKEESNKVYTIGPGGTRTANAMITNNLMLSMYINKELVISKGNGSETNPYVIAYFSKK